MHQKSTLFNASWCRICSLRGRGRTKKKKKQLLSFSGFRLWASGEPSGGQGVDEDCAQIKVYNSENSWNDAQCDTHISWICEKKSSQ